MGANTIIASDEQQRDLWAIQYMFRVVGLRKFEHKAVLRYIPQCVLLCFRRNFVLFSGNFS